MPIEAACKVVSDYYRGQPWLVAVGIGKDELIVYTAHLVDPKKRLNLLCQPYDSQDGFPIRYVVSGRFTVN